ncbi:MAG TPA: lipopolysaccharide transport periplasmic protein LptA [Steroidobacteraceae bacterium]|jgi:lipopolysaccharide transport protein LptA|nr:lipopolysaccharide transport periplasmic protein LptA [Steroidobacteraceae bacterium]
MAPSCPKARRLLLSGLTACAAAAAQAAPAPAAAGPPAAVAQASRQLPITVDAASSEVDYRTNTVVFSQVVISQGAMRVQADHAHASGLNFANSRWTFDGHVRIDAEPRGSLRSDQAVVEFRDNRIARATASGKPAEFEQPRGDSQQMARGHADEIVYDVNEGTVRLSNDAWLSDGTNEISGPLLVYNIRAQRVQAAAQSGTDQRVHIIIQPQGAPAAPPGKTHSEPGKTPPPAPKS